MNFLEILFPSVTAAVLTGLALFLVQKLAITRLTKTVQGEFDAKLAELNSRLRTSEEAFKADLKRKEIEILALQGGAMQSRLSRLVAVEKRRLEAVDQIWGAVYDLSFAKALAASVSGLKWEAISKEVAKNPRAKDAFAVFKIDEEKYGGAGKLARQARPFITPMAWAYYSAYEAILMHAVALMKMLQLGIDGLKFLKSEELIALIKTALPYQAEYIDQHGPSAAYYLLDQLENRLLAELKSMLDGGEADMTEVARAKKILDEAARVNFVVNEVQTTPAVTA
jgi:hypothetical protein